MKHLVFVACVCVGVVAMAAGCVAIEDSNGAGYGSSTLEVRWNLIQGDSNAQTTCPSAVTTSVIAEPIDDGDEFIDNGDEIVSYFDCDTFVGLTAPYPPGTYLVWINILDNTGGLIAQSVSQQVSLSLGERVPLDYTISLDRGSFGLSWTITNGSTELGCAAVNADVVRIESTLQGPAPKTFFDDLLCEWEYEATLGLPLGDYQLSVSLLDAQGVALGEPYTLSSSLDFGNDFRDLGNFEFVLSQFAGE